MDEARHAFGRQVRGLLAGGVDGFILETFSDVNEIGAAILAVREQCDLPVIAQMTVGTDGKTHYGTDPDRVRAGPRRDGRRRDRRELLVGPHGVLEAIEKLARVVTVPLSAQPNAGLPREVGDRKIYMASPEYMASYARRIVEAGARFVGGCCGTTPDHIRAIVGFVQSVSPRHISAVAAVPLPATAVDPVPLAERSRLGAKLAEGRFVTTVEIVPPKGVDPAPMFEQVPAAQGSRGRRGQRARRAAGPEPDGRAPLRAHDPARGRPRGGGPLRLPRPQPARHAVRPAGRRGGGHQQPADRDRRSAEDGPLPRGHRGLRHRQHRAHQPGVAAQPRARPWRQSDRQADPVRRRRRSEPGRARPRAGARAGSPGRWRRERSSRSPSRCSTWSSSTASCGRSRRSGSRSSPASGRWCRSGTPSSSPTRSRASRFRTRCSTGCGRRARTARKPHWRKGVRISREMLAAVAERVQGVQVSAPLGRVPVALEVLAGAPIEPATARGYTPPT